MRPNGMSAAVAVLLVGAAAGSASAQQATEKGVVQGVKLRGGTGVMGQIAVGDFQIGHQDGFKGAQRVAISVFNVAFPDENRFSANLHKKAGGLTFAAKSTMHTKLTGVDNATRQRIADAAYADFVADLKGAGYEVVEPDALAKLTPEYASWTAMPNFTRGRFGSYVAPTGRQVYFLPADASKRDSSGQLGQMGLAFRGLDRPQAFMRSAYIARDGNLGIIAVTLVVDYGVYSTSGESRKVKAGSSTSFDAGVTVQSGTLGDTATLLDYWRPASGGFPATAALAVPVYSAEPVGTVIDDVGDIDATLQADPAKFEKVALGVVRDAGAKLVAVMAAAR